MSPDQPRTKLSTCIAVLAVLLAKGPVERRWCVNYLRARGFGHHTVRKAAALLGVERIGHKMLPQLWKLPAKQELNALPGLLDELDALGRQHGSAMVRARAETRRRGEGDGKSANRSRI